MSTGEVNHSYYVVWPESSFAPKIIRLSSKLIVVKAGVSVFHDLPFFSSSEHQNGFITSDQLQFLFSTSLNSSPYT